VRSIRWLSASVTDRPSWDYCRSSQDRARTMTTRRVHEKCATSIQVQRSHPGLPAQWLYGLYALPVNGLSCTVTCRSSTSLHQPSRWQDNVFAVAQHVRQSASASTASTAVRDVRNAPCVPRKFHHSRSCEARKEQHSPTFGRVGRLRASHRMVSCSMTRNTRQQFLGLGQNLKRMSRHRNEPPCVG